MTYLLLLVNAEGGATTSQLAIRQLREFPGNEGLSVHFRPVRNDRLFESAKFAGGLAYRILSGEGVGRSQLWVEYEVLGAHINVTGRSSDLMFALALVTSKWKTNNVCPAIAATGVLDAEGRVQSVEHAPEKIAAAVREFESATRAVIFYPAADAATVDAWRATSEVPEHIELQPVGHVEDALTYLGYTLEKVYLHNPFRGLQHFDYEHHSIFFGRDREIREVVRQLLRREASGASGLLVEGASGSGKSSFLRAGVLPTLVDLRFQADEVQDAISRRPVALGVRHAIWRPGLLPSGADEGQLALSIRACWAALSEIRSTIESSEVKTLAALAWQRREYWPETKRFVWLIDQFEEFFDMGLAAHTIDLFGQFLKQLQVEGVWTLTSMRADAVPTLKEYESLRGIFGANEGQYYLATLSGPALDDVINRPAKAADLTFGLNPEGKSLDQLLREDAYREKDSLPLLQFTLNELYQKRSGKELTFAAYQQLGGLAGSIATTAAAILNDEAVESQRTAPRVFRSLVSVDEFGRATRRYAPMKEVAHEPRQRNLVLRLVEARLCVTDHREGESVVAFAHDSLLRTLPAFVSWLKQESALLQTRELAERDARLWQQHGQSKSWLATSDKVVTFEKLAATEVSLTPDARDFIDRSRRQVRRTTRIKRLAVITIAGLAVVTSVAAWIAFSREREAEFQTAQAREAQLQLLTQSAAERLKDGDLTLARGIELEVLRRRDPEGIPDPAAMNVLQEVRASDPALAILTGHSGPVRQVSYSPDGMRILTSSDDNTARIWDSRTGIELAVLRGKGSICSVAFSSDGKHVLISSDDGTNGVWDVSLDAKVVTVQSRVDHCGWTFPTDGGRFVTSDGKALQVWDARTGRQLAELERPPRPALLSGDLSPDSTHFAAGADDNTARVWDMRTGKQVLTLSGHLSIVHSIRYSPDGQRIVTTSQDNTARIWDAKSGAELTQVGHIGMAFDAAFSPDGKWIASVSGDLTARISDAASGKQLQLFSGHTSILWTVAFSPDGTRLATGAGDGTARTWSLRRAQNALVIGDSAYKIAAAAYSPDSSRLLALSADQPPRILDAHSGAILAELSGQRDAHGVAVYSPDGRHVLASIANSLRIWDATTGSTVLDIPGPAPVTDTLAYSPDGKRIVAAFEDYSLQIRDATTGSLLIEDRAGKSYFTSVEFSPDGRRILTGSLDNTARIYDAGTLRQLTIFPHKDAVRHAAFSPDGSRIVTACHDGVAYIWDAHTGAKLQTLAGHHAYVWGAAFSPDGSRVVTASRDQSVRIWDAQTGIELAVLTGHQGRIERVGYSPDGNYILSTSSLDNTARIWDARVPAEWRSQITWEQAVEPDSLSDVQRTTLGIATTFHVLTGRALSMTDRSGHSASAQASGDACSQNAAAYYDPDRTAPGLEQASIQADVALSACSTSSRVDASGRIAYQRGRALLAKGDAGAARMEWESALARGYRAARVDLALLLTDPTGKMLEPVRATSLLEAAWHSGVVTAAFDLGTLYEHGVPAGDSGIALQPDRVRASFWYDQGARRLEPHALAHAAQHAEFQALVGVPAEADAGFFLAFRLYSQAAQQAQALGWPDSVWRSWRYRRSTLARMLALEGKMQEVADAYARFVEREP